MFHSNTFDSLRTLLVLIMGLAVAGALSLLYFLFCGIYWLTQHITIS